MNQSNTNFNSPDAVENAFYKAFANCDTEAMGKIWANDNVVCIHPGSSALIGYDAVLRSWRTILDNSEPPNLHFEVVNQYTSNDLTIHIVEEQIRSETTNPETVAIVLATNIFRRDENGWHMIEHHASLSRRPHTQHTLQ
jgi:ketosteroid isomerase-like protein